VFYAALDEMLLSFISSKFKYNRYLAVKILILNTEVNVETDHKRIQNLKFQVSSGCYTESTDCAENRICS
jgi:hypothetical protein